MALEIESGLTEHELLERIFGHLTGSGTRILIPGAFTPKHDRTPAFFASRGFHVKVMDIMSGLAYKQLAGRAKRLRQKARAIPLWSLRRLPERRRLLKLAQTADKLSRKYVSWEGKTGVGDGDGLSHVVEWEKAKKSADAGGTVRFWHGNFLLPHRWLSKGCMDAIFCRGAHHFMGGDKIPDEEKAISLMVRYLRPGGVLAIAFQHDAGRLGRRVESLQRVCAGTADLRIHGVRMSANRGQSMGTYHYEYMAEIRKK